MEDFYSFGFTLRLLLVTQVMTRETEERAGPGPSKNLEVKEVFLAHHANNISGGNTSQEKSERG